MAQLRHIALLSATLFLFACGDDTGSSNNPDFDAGNNEVDAGANAVTPESGLPVRTLEGAVAHWSGRPDLTENRLVDSVGGQDFEFSDSTFWYDPVENGVFLGQGNEIVADFTNNEFADREMSIDVWWNPAPRDAVTLVRVGDPDDPLVTLRYEAMRNLVLIGRGTEPLEVRREVWDRDREDPVHFTLAIADDGTVRLFVFGTLVQGLILPEEGQLSSNTTVTIADADDDGAQGTLRTATIYGRHLDEAEIWDNWVVGPSPSEADEVAESPDRFVAFVVPGRDRNGVTAVTSTWLDKGAPDSVRSSARAGDVGREDVVLTRIVVDNVPYDGEVTRADVRGFARSFDFETPREISVANLLVPWTVEEATWNVRSFELPWGAEGASAPGEDYELPTVNGLVSGRGPFLLPVGIEEVQRWMETPDQNYGIRIDADISNGIQLCLSACEAPRAFMAALIGERAGAGNPGPAPDVERPGPEDDLTLSIDSPSGKVEVYGNGRFLGTAVNGTFRDPNYRDSTAYRVYGFDLEYVRSQATDVEPVE